MYGIKKTTSDDFLTDEDGKQIEFSERENAEEVVSNWNSRDDWTVEYEVEKITSRNKYNRKKCPECGGDTEFVQFGGSDCSTVETTPEEVKDRLLELRMCLNCKSGVEFILEPVSAKTIPYNNDNE